MKPDFQSETALRAEAMNILVEHLGALNTERFINSILKDQFDYTEWQRNLWDDKTIKKIHQEATAFYKEKTS
ncbi:MAG: hypothetical protein LBC20_02125 [Planctomycetaceae bacterium]|jgi:hypothetical protein|nr:hypothetical protein [Planctomycetaceae bacterium]